MTTVDSTATLSLTMVVTEEPAGKDPLGNPIIRIEVGTATFHCRSVEHVGKQRPRKVTFQADAPCNLHFTEFAVFQKNDARLVKGNNDLTVFCEDGVGTSYYLDGKETVKSPPKIVVP